MTRSKVGERERDIGSAGLGKLHELGFELGTPVAQGVVCRHTAHKAIGAKIFKYIEQILFSNCVYKLSLLWLFLRCCSFRLQHTWTFFICVFSWVCVDTLVFYSFPVPCCGITYISLSSVKILNRNQHCFNNNSFLSLLILCCCLFLLSFFNG